MRLIDEDKAKEVLTDYYHIHTTIQQLAMDEAFSRIPTVEAIPIEWLKEEIRKAEDPYNDEFDVLYAGNLSYVLKLWAELNDEPLS